jgi:vacuolar-type H+-ATPase subunit H
MDQQDILQHLLQVESSASELVNDARAEADRRLSESEKRGRALYDEQYGQAVLDLEAWHKKELSALTERVQLQLEAYREELRSLPVDRDAFFRCLDTWLAKAR